MLASQLIKELKRLTKNTSGDSAKDYPIYYGCGSESLVYKVEFIPETNFFAECCKKELDSIDGLSICPYCKSKTKFSKRFNRIYILISGDQPKIVASQLQSNLYNFKNMHGDMKVYLLNLISREVSREVVDIELLPDYGLYEDKVTDKYNDLLPFEEWIDVVMAPNPKYLPERIVLYTSNDSDDGDDTESDENIDDDENACELDWW